MTNTGHIQGPWTYSQESADPEWWIVTIPGGLIVANVNAHAKQEANARLIAASPALLSAAIDVVNLLSDEAKQDGGAYLAIHALEAAIAQATVSA